MEDKKDYKEIIEAVVEGIKPTIEDTIKKIVNGKIDALHSTLNPFILKVETHLEEDAKWKKNLQPVSKGIKTIYNLRDFGVFWSGVIAPWAVIVGLLAMVYNHFK